MSMILKPRALGDAYCDFLVFIVCSQFFGRAPMDISSALVRYLS